MHWKVNVCVKESGILAGIHSCSPHMYKRNGKNDKTKLAMKCHIGDQDKNTSDFNKLKFFSSEPDTELT